MLRAVVDIKASAVADEGKPPVRARLHMPPHVGAVPVVGFPCRARPQSHAAGQAERQQKRRRPEHPRGFPVPCVPYPTCSMHRTPTPFATGLFRILRPAVFGRSRESCRRFTVSEIFRCPREVVCAAAQAHSHANSGTAGSLRIKKQSAFRFHRKICVNFPKVTGLFIHFSQTGCIMYGFYQARNIPIYRAQRPERKEAGLWQATHSNAWRKK